MALLQQGFSIEDIVITRQLHESTIYSHIAQLYQTKELNDISNYYNESDLVAVRKAREETGETKLLNPIYIHLQEAVPHHIIRLCLSVIDREEKDGVE